MNHLFSLVSCKVRLLIEIPFLGWRVDLQRGLESIVMFLFCLDKMALEFIYLIQTD